MLGALLIVLIRQSIRTLHFDQNYEWIVIGCAIIIAVVIDQWSTRMAARRLSTGGRVCACRGMNLTQREKDMSARRGQVERCRAGRRLCVAALACSGGGESKPARPETRAGTRRRRGRGGKTIRIAMIAKSSDNPVFLAARTGAEAAAKELSEKNGMDRSRSTGSRRRRRTARCRRSASTRR